MLGVLACLLVLWSSALVIGETKTQQNYQINQKPCWVNGAAGKCMFVWECINSGGSHIGMCVDTFMFGTCCAHNGTQPITSQVGASMGERERNPGEPAILYSPPRRPKPPSQSRPSDHPTTRPTFITRPQRPHLSSSHIHDKWTKPETTTIVESHIEGNQLDVTWTPPQIGRPSGLGVGFVTRPEGRPTKLRPPPPPASTTTTTTTSSTTSSTTTSRATTTTTPLPTTTTLATISASQESASNGECGRAPLHPRPEVRIVGGRNAQFGVWPWQVSVRRTSFFGFSSTHRCGGALINEKWIATAGHCVDDLLTSQIRIRVGEYDFSSVQEPFPFAERGVARKVVHPKYNFYTYEYDLALVRLDAPLEFAPHIAPICLPGSDDLLIGENATVTGWGRLSDGGTLPSVLQEVTVPILSNEKCKSMFLRAGRHEFFPDIFMCAGFDDGGRDACQGDSGGPLQVRGKDGRFFLAGIISWGIGCAEANLPGVCTRISKFVPWILQTVT